MTIFKISIIMGTALVLTAGAAAASVDTHAVPEIDGMAGLVAMGAIGAVMAYVWERRRKQR
jgi:hypothetical protein